MTNFLRTSCGIDEDDEHALHHELSKSFAIQDQQCVSKMLDFVPKRGLNNWIGNGTTNI